MTQKDWILLIVPILGNGVVVFALQKVFEKRQMAITAKQKYVLVLQEKLDTALALFMNVLQTSGEDKLQIDCLNQFIQSFVDIHYYYQQNITLFRAIRKEMDKAIKVYEAIQSNELRLIETENNLTIRIQNEELFRTLYSLLQKIQKKCVNYKI